MKKILLPALLMIVTGCSENAKRASDHREPMTATSPNYPELKKGTAFDVVVRAIISKEGGNENCQVVSSQNPHLNETALKMCRQRKPLVGERDNKNLVGRNRLMHFQFRMAD